MDLIAAIKNTTDQKTYETFCDIMLKFKQSSMKVETLYERVNQLIGNYPELFQKFAVFLRADSKEAQDAKKKIVTHRLANMKTPTKFSADTFPIIANHLPLASLARISETCLWAKTQVTPAMFDSARQRARLTHGLFDVISVRELRIRSTNDESISIGPVREGLSSLRVRINNTRYVAEITDGSMANFLADALKSEDEVLKNTKIWFRFEGQDGDLIHIKLFAEKIGQAVQKASITCILP